MTANGAGRWHIVDLLVGLVIGALAGTAGTVTVIGTTVARQDERLTTVIEQVREVRQAVRRLEEREK